MIYKLQYREEKDKSGAVIYDLTTDGKYQGYGDYQKMTQYVYDVIDEGDIYQEQRPNGEIYHESTAGSFKKMLEDNPYRKLS